jgi:hypothetical protein
MNVGPPEGPGSCRKCYGEYFPLHTLHWEATKPSDKGRLRPFFLSSSSGGAQIVDLRLSIPVRNDNVCVYAITRHGAIPHPGSRVASGENY